MEGPRAERLLRVVGEIYPILQRIEAKALPESEWRLAGVSVNAALRKDTCIERALPAFLFPPGIQMSSVSLMRQGKKLARIRAAHTWEPAD